MTAFILKTLIRAYRLIPFRPKCRCGGQVSCSKYCLDAVGRYGAAAALVVLAAGSGCGSGNGPTGNGGAPESPINCNFQAEIGMHSPPTINAKVLVDCDPSPASFQMTATIQSARGRGNAQNLDWSDVNSDNTTSIPDAHGYGFDVAAQCQNPLRYRLLVTWSGTNSEGGQSPTETLTSRTLRVTDCNRWYPTF